MEMNDLGIDIKSDEASISRYSSDMSRYRIRPRMIATPESESDVLEMVEFSKKEGIPITARAAGSNLSGNAVGSGMIVLFNKMNSIIEKKGDLVRFQPGLVYDRLNDDMRGEGYFLPYHVSSSKFCSLGGNVATRASGLRSIKYGTVDTSVTNIRMIDTVHGIVDTRKGLDEGLKDDLLQLKEELLSHKRAMDMLRSKEGLKTSLGYNLWSLYKYERAEDMMAHLVVGSAGTLGLFTEIEMRLKKIPDRRVMIVAVFQGLSETGAAVPDLQTLDPSLLELMDRFGTEIVREETSLNIPEEAASTLLIEFDENVDDGREKAVRILEEKALAYNILTDPADQKKIWGLRWKMLLEIKRANETKDKRYLSFVDDLGVPLHNLPDFITEIEEIFREEDVQVVVYGHIGEGNLHVRPLIHRSNWKEDMRRIGERCFETAFKYNGTLAAEHGAGRNRSEFMRQEWGAEVYDIMKKVKEIFDPHDIFNPGIMFSSLDFTENLEF